MKQITLVTFLFLLGICKLSYAQENETYRNKKQEIRAGLAVSPGGIYSFSYERFVHGEFSIGLTSRYSNSPTQDFEEDVLHEKFNLSFKGRYYNENIFTTNKSLFFYMEGTAGYSILSQLKTRRILNNEGNFVISRDWIDENDTVLSFGLGAKVFFGKHISVDTGFGLGGYLSNDVEEVYGFLNLEIGYRF